MRLLFITQKVDKDDDVLGVYHRWIEELAKKVEKISVICLFRGRVELPANVAVYSLGKEKVSSIKTSILRFYYTCRFYKIIWKLHSEYDTVFVHMNPEYLILVGWWWRLTGKKVILWYAHYLATWRLHVAQFLAHGIVTSTRRAYPLQSRKLTVLQQGIDVEKFKIQKSRLRQGFGGQAKFKALFLGRIAPVKHLEVLLRAISILRSSNDRWSFDDPDIALTIVGGPTFGKVAEAAYYEKIKKLVIDLGLEQTVNFLPPVPNTETPEIYNQHDLFINLTDTGSFDKTTLEAMACGLPVLVSNKAFEEIFPADLRPHLMFQEKNAEDLADKIAGIINWSPPEREHIGAVMRELIVKKHSLKGLIDKLTVYVG